MTERGGICIDRSLHVETRGGAGVPGIAESFVGARVPRL